MVERIKNLFIPFCIIVSFSCGIINLGAEPNPYPNVEIPIVPDAYNISKSADEAKGLKSVKYCVTTEYPAAEVLKFYDKRFTDKGWTRSSRGGLGTRAWECFIDGTVAGDPRVRQQLALWNGPSLGLEAFLALRYMQVEKEWSNELQVICQIQPLIDTVGLEKFLRKLDQSKQHAEFMELLDSYRMPNGEVDINKALKENPTNDYLEEYKRIIDDMKRKPKAGRKPVHK